MATDYISRETAIEVLCGHCQDIDYGEDEDTCWCMKKDRLNQIPAADVRPVGEISDSVDETIDFLNSVSNQMPYHVYSALFDLVSGICSNCGADMREVEP